MFKGEKIYLRQIETTDSSTLLLWENDTENWRYSVTEAPYSMAEINAYVMSASRIYENKQLRMMICRITDDRPVGTVDLFAIDFKNKRAGVGILIADKNDRNLHFATESLQLIEEYAFKQIGLIQLHCDIQEDNTHSIHLFEGMNYQKMGRKKEWYLLNGKVIDVFFYQKFLTNEQQ